MKKNYFTVLFISVLIFAQGLQAQAQAPAQTPTPEVNDSAESSRVPVTTGKYITGGVIGSVFGFGIGHGIQGRYSEKGYLFTASGVLGTLGMLQGLSSCYKSQTGTKDFKNCSDSEKQQFTLGYSLFLGFHVWEIISLWAGAQPVSESNDTSAMILPYGKDGAQLAFALRF